MKYVLLIHQGTTPTPRTEGWDAVPEADQREQFAAYAALNATPGVTPGAGLDQPDTATTVRVRDGETLITDGPFAELKEAIGGFCFYEGPDLDAAIAVASKIPAARIGGAVEVRPILDW